MISKYIHSLIQYGIRENLIDKADTIYVRDRLLHLLHEDEYSECDEVEDDLVKCLEGLCKCAIQKGLIEDTIAHKDLFDTELMDCLTPMPSIVQKTFFSLKEESAKKATDYYYDFSQKTNYIRKYRIVKDKKWQVETEFGKLDITINLSKPEKDPKAIAEEGKAVMVNYPKCQLCIENEGYAGRMNHPARGNHRLIPLTLANEEWYLQYSPYVYYNEHCIVLNAKHVPMKMERATFRKLLDFVEEFPHYFIGSNADLPIVGGSILSHEHFQGGRHTFAMEVAKVEKKWIFKGYEDVEAGIVKWPMSVIRLRSEDKKKIEDLSTKILERWRNYSDPTCDIYAYTEDEPHNTITPICRMKDGKYEMDLVLRNNRTTNEHPLGIFHPHSKLHHIKKENIGLIEVMGLAVLPGRLAKEMEILEEALVNQYSENEYDESIQKHIPWAKEIASHYSITQDNTKDILKKEIGMVFMEVLKDAGVYKRNEQGLDGFVRFLENINEE
ncbi:MAG: UDP-glucose--hexose-1-phosphate uridylyltransferase [Solobacterium sp.]|nr:UDP-glucose--hexose-1-phosphate uridylyltransferase [Solobacterium sp.]